jgi:propanediol dehydratase large subunit
MKQGRMIMNGVPLSKEEILEYDTQLISLLIEKYGISFDTAAEIVAKSVILKSANLYPDVRRKEPLENWLPSLWWEFTRQ